MESLEQLIEKSDFKAASQFLESHKKNLNDEIYWFYKGVVSESTGEMAQARHAFERAKWLSPLKTDHWKKLSEIKTKLKVSEIESASNWKDYYHPFMTNCPTSLIFICSLAILLIVMNFFKIFKHKWSLVTMVVLSLVPGLFSLYYWSHYEVKVLTSSLSVQSGPSLVFPEEASLDPGTLVVFETDKGGWKKILYPSSAKGWAKEVSGLRFNRD
jgi:hypothetical protein